MTRQVRALGQPPATLTGFPRWPLMHDRTIYRAHRHDLNPWWFASAHGIGGDGRFDLADPYGTCYLAATPSRALRERWGTSSDSAASPARSPTPPRSARCTCHTHSAWPTPVPRRQPPMASPGRLVQPLPTTSPSAGPPPSTLLAGAASGTSPAFPPARATSPTPSSATQANSFGPKIPSSRRDEQLPQLQASA